MQSVVDATLSGQVNGEVVALVTNKHDIFAIERAKKHSIDFKTFSLSDYKNNEDRDLAIVEYLKPYNIDLIVLAGYLAIVTPILVDKYEGRIINIHPSLIPNHCGKGMYGIKVHNVDHGADTGQIIKQVRVPVEEGDTPESLQARVLEQEHKLLPEVVAKLCEN